MKKFIIAVSAIAFATTAAFADVIADRKAVMKENGKQVGVLVKMVQGEADFDAAAVMAALTRLNENVQAIDVAASFPPGSDKGDTTASPKIWEDMAGFQAAVDKFKAVTAEAAAAPAQDLEALKPQVAAIGQSCSSCHEAFRIKKG
ncbi:MAG TPA: cytochrome c [Pseudaminobacter sp.]|jgi:cytochrome c556|nr:cytochrome c [Pseudaminobacter sp.]